MGEGGESNVDDSSDESDSEGLGGELRCDSTLQWQSFGGAWSDDRRDDDRGEMGEMGLEQKDVSRRGVLVAEDATVSGSGAIGNTKNGVDDAPSRVDHVDEEVPSTGVDHVDEVPSTEAAGAAPAPAANEPSVAPTSPGKLRRGSAHSDLPARADHERSSADHAAAFDFSLRHEKIKKKKRHKSRRRASSVESVVSEEAVPFQEEVMEESEEPFTPSTAWFGPSAPRDVQPPTVGEVPRKKREASRERAASHERKRSRSPEKKSPEKSVEGERGDNREERSRRRRKYSSDLPHGGRSSPQESRNKSRDRTASRNKSRDRASRRRGTAHTDQNNHEAITGNENTDEDHRRTHDTRRGQAKESPLKNTGNDPSPRKSEPPPPPKEPKKEPIFSGAPNPLFHADTLFLRLGRPPTDALERAVRLFSLPPGWREHPDSNTKTFYFHEKSLESQWQHPLEHQIQQLFQLTETNLRLEREDPLVSHGQLLSQLKTATAALKRAERARARMELAHWAGPFASEDSDREVFFYNSHEQRSQWIDPVLLENYRVDFVCETVDELLKERENELSEKSRFAAEHGGMKGDAAGTTR